MEKTSTFRFPCVWMWVPCRAVPCLRVQVGERALCLEQCDIPQLITPCLVTQLKVYRG